MKSRSSLLTPAHPGGPAGKRAVNGCGVVAMEAGLPKKTVTAVRKLI